MLQLLLDGNFIFNAVRCSVDIRQAMERLLQTADFELNVPRAVITELSLLGASVEPAMRFARSCKVLEAATGEKDEDVEERPLKRPRRDGSTPAAQQVDSPAVNPYSAILEAVEAREAVRGVVLPPGGPRGGKRRRPQDEPAENAPFFVATQDQKLRDRLRDLPGVPVVTMNRNVMFLEAPSRASVRVSDEVRARDPGCKVSIMCHVICSSLTWGCFLWSQMGASLDTLGDQERRLVESLMGADDAQENVAPPKRKRRGPKQPNPLSMKKPKPKPTAPQSMDGEAMTTRRRNRRKKGKRGHGTQRQPS